MPVVSIRASSASLRDCAQMRALTPDGGIGEHVGTRLAKGERDELDDLAQLRGLSRAQYARLALRNQMEADRARTAREVTAEAS